MALAAAAKRFIPIKKKTHSPQNALQSEPEFEESSVSEPRPVQRQWQEVENADLAEGPSYMDNVTASFSSDDYSDAPLTATLAATLAAEQSADEALDMQHSGFAEPALQSDLQPEQQPAPYSDPYPDQQEGQHPSQHQGQHMETELSTSNFENLPPQGATPPAGEEANRIPYEDIDPDVVYLIPGLLDSLDMALDDAYAGKEHGSFLAVSEACMRLAGTADAHGLKVLKGIANCVERAAQANDMDAVDDLLAELAASVQNNRKKLEAIYTAYTSQDKY